jgi:hypothetical protein
MPRASEKASAMAIVGTSLRTAIRECVPEFRPTISPSVVMTPDVMPKLIPILRGSLIRMLRPEVKRAAGEIRRGSGPVGNRMIDRKPGFSFNARQDRSFSTRCS